MCEEGWVVRVTASKKIRELLTVLAYRLAVVDKDLGTEAGFVEGEIR